MATPECSSSECRIVPEEVPLRENATTPLSADQTLAPSQGPSSDDHKDDELAVIPSESLLKHLLRAVSSVFEPSHTEVPSTGEESAPATILSFYAHTGTGRELLGDEKVIGLYLGTLGQDAG